MDQGRRLVLPKFRTALSDWWSWAPLGLVLWMWRIGVPILVALTLPPTIADLGPSWQARFGSGTPGTFTAVYESCGSKSCIWRGDFVSDDRRPVRNDVGLASGGATLSGRARRRR